MGLSSGGDIYVVIPCKGYYSNDGSLQVDCNTMLTLKNQGGDMFSFLNTFKRLIRKQQEAPTTQPEYSSEQLLQWTTGCMLEGLPDTFYEARITCFRSIDNDGRTAIAAIHDFKLTSESEYISFTPPDDLYATHCIEKILNEEIWSKATITFNPQTTRFMWQ